MDQKQGRGFTLVEVVTVMMIVSVLARIAIPQMQEILTRARATEVRASFSVVEEAATRLSIENEPWPDDTDAGVVPPGWLICCRPNSRSIANGISSIGSTGSFRAACPAIRRYAA